MILMTNRMQLKKTFSSRVLKGLGTPTLMKGHYLTGH
jgi:hypothetical protein